MRGAERSARLIARLLEDERAALLGGRHARLADLAQRKAILVNELAASDTGRRILARLRPAFARNLALMGAVRAGLAGIRATSAGSTAALRTYDSDGRTGATGPAGPQLLRRI